MMTQMTSFSSTSPFAGEGAPLAPADAPDAIRLKRVGARPLAFEGEELCMAMSFIPGMPMWFEINVWRTASGGFVTAVKQFHRDADRVDTCRAWEASSFEEVMSGLERFDPAQDMEMDPEPGRHASAAELSAAALAMRARIAEARRQYDGLVGEILFELENG